MRHLLIANSSANASSGFYYDLRHEYLSLSDEDVGDSIELMSALAVLYDLLLRPEQSEYWRKKVAEQTRSRDRRRRQEALRQSLYLDICLIHTGSRDLLMTLNKAGRLILAGGFDLPEFSVTSNLPSLMNGGKDFSHWSAHDLAIARTSGPFISRLLGRYGAGLVELGLAESLFEKGGEALDVLHLISRAEMAIQSGGKLEMSFAACALRARVLVGQGQAAEACSLLLKFRKTLLAAEAGQMIANLDALHCRISLLRGDELAVDGWLGKQDDTGEEFFTLHRYRYLTLVRVWIAKEQYYQALSLLDKLEYYCELAGRMMHCIEINLLRGQIFWQMNKPWQKPVLEAMVMACRLRYYPIVSAQSAEICSMLKAIREEASRHPDLDDEWLCRIEKEAARFASLYPSCRQEEKPVLSRNGLRILRLQAKGFTAREIADILHLKMDNVQYHIKENYRRMQVSNKAEALLYAREIGLV